jgi:hypothetical protein
MPCQGGPNPPDWEISCYKEEIDKLSSLLCSLCDSIESANLSPELVSFLMPKKVISWWRNHKYVDESRKASERKLQELSQLRENALAKLSKKEKTALGLDK